LKYEEYASFGFTGHFVAFSFLCRQYMSIPLLILIGHQFQVKIPLQVTFDDFPPAIVPLIGSQNFGQDDT